MKYCLLASLLMFTGIAFAADTPSESGNQSLLDNIGSIIGWFEVGSYKWADTMLERIASWVIVWWLEAKLFALQLSLSIAETFISALGISDTIQAALNGLPDKVTSFVLWLKIPEALNTIISAYGVRIVMGML